MILTEILLMIVLILLIVNIGIIPLPVFRSYLLPQSNPLESSWHEIFSYTYKLPITPCG